MPRIDVFAGERPAITPRLLENANAAKAVNCLLTNGDMRPLESSAALGTQPTLAASAESLYLYGSNWFSWSSHVSAVSSPIAQDQYDRVYIAGLDCPRYTRNDIASGAGVMPQATYKLGVPAPEAPTVTYTAGTDADPLDNETRYYICTYLTTLGEESKPSPLSPKLEIVEPETDVVTVNLPSPTVNEQDIAFVCIYRSGTGGDSAGYFKVGKVAVGTATFDDDPAVVTLGELVATEHYDLPPADMHSLVKTTYGFLVGASGYTVCPSESGLPYAYKTSNQQPANARIVAMAALPGGVVVATEGYPELLTGYSPDTTSLSRLELEQSCVSARSMVDMGMMAIYASPDGLVGVTVSGANLITEAVIEQKEWQALNPATIHAYQHDGLYIGFYDGIGGFVYDPQQNDISFLDFYASTGYRDLKTDALYLVIGGVLTKWRSGTPLVATWRSKIFKTSPSSFMLFRVKHEFGSDFTETTVNIINEEGVHYNDTLTTQEWGYSPGGLFENWQIEVSTTQVVEALVLGNSFEEIEV